MVTDEERDYMNRTYARDREMRINLGIRRRLAPLLENDRRRIELMNALLFSLPGTPVIYYGDEIGMGDNVFLGDRNGVRTPMQWSSDRNAGFSRTNPQRLYLPVNIDPEYHYETVNVEAQQNNPHSLLWWTKRLIQQRKQFRAFGSGSLEFLYPSNRKVLAFIRQFGDEKVLVVANLSRFTQCVELDLTSLQGSVPVEVFGRTKFPSVTEHFYLLSLGPHAFYWFHLQPRETTQESLNVSGAPQELPVVAVGLAEDVFSEDTLQKLQHFIPSMLRSRPWFLGKRRYITRVALQNVLALPETSAHLLFLNVEYGDGDPEVYLVPISVATGDKSEAILRERPEVVLARLDGPGPETTALLYASTFDRDFSDSLLRAIVRRRKIRGEFGELVGAHTREFRKAWTSARSNLEPSPQRTDQCFTVINYGEDFVLKLYRNLEEGINPGREVPEFLCEQTGFTAIPRALGSLDYRRDSAGLLPQICIGTLSSFVPHATNGWTYTLDHLGLFFEHALAIPQEDSRLRDLKSPDLWAPTDGPLPPLMAELVGNHVDSIRLLAQRTAEMHLALSSRSDITDFAPEPFTTFYRQGIYHGIIGQLNRSFETLRGRIQGLSANARADISEVLNREGEIRDRLLLLRDKRLSGNRIRQHGDYQLTNVLYSGSDWVITNFEGDPYRPLSERRIKRSAVRDVATMLRSFHYASHAALFGDVPGIVPSRESHPQLEKWARTWYQWVSAIFIQNYLRVGASGNFLPQTAEEVRILLGAYMIERALTEIEYELEHRPEWIRIPVHGILEQLKPSESQG